MGCFKTLTLSGGCVLETCETKDVVVIGDDTFPFLAYSPDHCYCLVLYNSAGFTTSYLGKYDPATNTIIQKADLGVYTSSQPVYDATAKKFVLSGGLGILTFDPVTETTDTFDPGITGLGTFLYVPQKGRVYGIMGVNGNNERYVGYIDLTLRTVVQLGIFPGIGAGRPRPNNNFAYSPVVDALYGNWASGVDQRLCKFDLATNTASYIVIGLNGARSFWDSNRNLLLMVSGALWEYDTATDTVINTIAQGPDFSMRSADFIDGNNQLWGWGRNSTTSYDGIVKINLTTQVWTEVLVDYQYYRPLTHFSGGSAIAMTENMAETEMGIRKVCLT